MKNDKAIAKTDNSPASLLQLGIEQNLDIDKLEKLMELKERYDAQEAKKAFLKAKTKFQSKCPVLKKSKKVSFNTVNYSYIPLGEIVSQIKDLLNKCGLSYRWETKEDSGKITITCIVSHIDGHSEQNSMTAGKDASGAKNDIQQIGSTMTYLQRYSLIGAFGISTADTDVDARKPVSDQKRKPNLNEKESRNLLIKCKATVDKYTKNEDLMAKCKKFVRDQTIDGMSERDLDQLKKYINIKSVSLKKETMDNKIKLV